jgi:hypothetical protein
MSGGEDLTKILHNLNNDLSVLVGHLDLALQQPKSHDDKMLKRLETMRRAADRIAEGIKHAQHAQGNGQA